MKKQIILIAIYISMMLPMVMVAQEQEIIITVIGKEPHQYEDIQFRGIEVNQIVDFSNLLRVYINKASVVMVNNKPVSIDKTGEAVREFLRKNVEDKYGDLTPATIENAQCEFKLLMRKSAYTDRENYLALNNMVNEAIWSLQKYYSNKVYNKEYPSLTQKQKDNINRLVPLENLLAKDNTD